MLFTVVVLSCLALDQPASAEPMPAPVLCGYHIIETPPEAVRNEEECAQAAIGWVSAWTDRHPEAVVEAAVCVAAELPGIPA